MPPSKPGCAATNVIWTSGHDVFANFVATNALPSTPIGAANGPVVRKYFQEIKIGPGYVKFN